MHIRRDRAKFILVSWKGNENIQLIKVQGWKAGQDELTTGLEVPPMEVNSDVAACKLASDNSNDAVCELSRMQDSPRLSMSPDLIE